MLKNKVITLGVCASVSFYKAYELISSLRKLGAKVKVVLSSGVLEFAKPLSFEAISDFEVLYDGAQNWQAGLNHIQYARSDLFILAPASANTINAHAHGLANNILTQTLLANSAPLVIAPAANDKMLEHFSTKASLNLLAQNGAFIVQPQLKRLACGEIGQGGLASISSIIYAAQKALSQQVLKGKKVLITGGATTEAIDSVRAITNHSSGKMSKALADEFYLAGADVCLAASFDVGEVPYRVLKFKTSKELFDIAYEQASQIDWIVMCAAVSDYILKNPYTSKLKKSDKELTLSLMPNIDILTSLKDMPCKKLGFKLETSQKDALKNAQTMLEKKGLDMVCLNVLENAEFGSEYNQISIITKNKISELGFDTKQNLARQIVKAVAKI